MRHTDAGTNQLGVMEDNLIALAFNLLQQMKNSDSNDFQIHNKNEVLLKISLKKSYLTLNQNMWAVITKID